MPLIDTLANARHSQSIIIFFIIMWLKKKVVGGNGARCVEAQMIKCFLSCTPLSCWLGDHLGSEMAHSFQLNWSHANSPSYPLAFYVHVQFCMCACVCVCARVQSAFAWHFQFHLRSKTWLMTRHAEEPLESYPGPVPIQGSPVCVRLCPGVR